MNNLAKHLVDTLLEASQGVTVLLPGGFKPPHGGHLDLVMNYFSLPQVSNVIILVGPTPRQGITQSDSIAIWKMLLKDVPNTQVIATSVESPLTAAYKYLETAPSGMYALASSSKGEDYARVKKFVQDHSNGGKYQRKGVSAVELPVDPKPLLYRNRTDKNNGTGISASVLRSDLATKNLKNFTTNYPDVPQDIAAKIYQRLTGRVNLSEMLTEGGGAGHLAHPYEDTELTFDDVEQMIDASLSGKLDLAQEKLDGQNLMISYKDNRLIAARNKTHLKNFGENALSIEEMKKMFSNRGPIQVAFVEAMKDLDAAISKLSPQDREEIFANGKNFISLEVLYPDTSNVIPYGAAQLRLHHVKTYDENGNVVSESQVPVAKLQSLIDSQKLQNQKTYQIRATDPAKVKTDEDYEAKKAEFLADLDNIRSRFDLSKNQKLSAYFFEWWKQYIEQNAKNYGYKIPKKVLNYLIRRWAFTDKSTSIGVVKKAIKNDDFRAWVTDFDRTEVNDQKKIAGKPIEMLFLRLGARVLKNLENLVALNPDESVRKIKKELDTAIDNIRAVAATPGYQDSEAATKFLKRELNRIKELGGYSAIVPTEGLVFTYKGKLYKLTGAFAPINQILGYMRFE